MKSKKLRIGITVGILGTAFAGYCFFTDDHLISSRNPANHTPSFTFDLPLQTELGEFEVQNEQASIQKLFQIMNHHMSKHYSTPGDHAYRAVHAKAHGCVNATFEVKDDIDPRFKDGVFASGRSFNAIVRFSNGDGPPENDSKLESRGMAVKLLNVSGPKLLAEDDALQSQDFLMADQPAFFLKDVNEYAQAMRARDGNLLIKGLFALKFRKQLAYRDSATPVLDPLNAQYWSKTPYQLGTSEVVKFTSRPCNFKPMLAPPQGEQNYMDEQMKAHLAKEDVCFDFLLQRRIETADRNDKMPIEDASVEWDTGLSPFQKVAEIHIAKGQDYDSPKNAELCENLSFNPWHALKVHRPLGNLNRVRKIVYDVSSTWRHQHNGASDH